MQKETQVIDPHKLPPLLLSPEGAAKCLGISRQEFYRNVSKICAMHGLQPVRVGSVKKYSYSELQKIVDHCVQTGEPLYTTTATPKRE